MAVPHLDGSAELATLNAGYVWALAILPGRQDTQPPLADASRCRQVLTVMLSPGDLLGVSCAAGHLTMRICSYGYQQRLCRLLFD